MVRLTDVPCQSSWRRVDTAARRPMRCGCGGSDCCGSRSRRRVSGSHRHRRSCCAGLGVFARWWREGAFRSCTRGVCSIRIQAPAGSAGARGTAGSRCAARNARLAAQQRDRRDLLSHRGRI